MNIDREGGGDATEHFKRHPLRPQPVSSEWDGSHKYNVYSLNKPIMARATPKKANGGAKTAKNADISTFFRTPSDQSKKPNGRSTEDSKPSLTPCNGHSRHSNGSITKAKGKERVTGGDTSADPVVISSDEEGEVKAKRQKTARSPSPVEVLDSSPGAGPSRLGSCSPPIRPVAGPALPPVPEKHRPAFEGVPEFQAPPTWPNIINTALDLSEEYDDGANASGDGNSDNDADSQHPGMFDEDLVDDGSDPEADVPAIEQPEDENLGPARGVSIDLTMEWDEGDDEGMGMEEPDDYDDPPDRSAKRPGQRGGKVGKCPVCAKSMKGKKDNVRPVFQGSCV